MASKLSLDSQVAPLAGYRTGPESEMVTPQVLDSLNVIKRA